MHDCLAECNSVKIHRRELKGIILYYSWFVYLVVPIRMEWQYSYLGFIGGRLNRISTLTTIPPRFCAFPLGFILIISISSRHWEFQIRNAAEWFDILCTGNNYYRLQLRRPKVVAFYDMRVCSGDYILYFRRGRWSLFWFTKLNIRPTQQF